LTDTRRSYLILHFVIFLWGFTAILGQLISISALPLVFYRLVITCLSLLVFRGLVPNIRVISTRTKWKLLGIGIIVTLHWIAFYGSIKLSSITVALACLATTSFFTSIIEPIVVRRKIDLLEVGLGILVIPGIFLIYYFTNASLIALIVGLFSALMAAIFPVLNSKFVKEIDAKAITFLELGAGAVLLGLLFPILYISQPDLRLIPNLNDLVWLLILGIVCTTLPFVLALNVLKKISAFSASLAINLEPIYGIILAIIIFKENKKFDNLTYLGLVIVLISVFSHPVIKYYLKSNEK